ncbi:MAG: TonB-dependent receptor plug domain-containing protein [Chitinophagaceae bacterium]
MAPVPAAAPVPLKLPAPGIISHGDDTISAWGTVNIKVPVNEPLIIVDGEPLPIGTNANSIDPATIESINVLKDKSATELYGKKGENGVVIITSKANSVKSETKVTERINGTTPKINITDKKKPFSGLIIIDGKESTPEAFSKIAPSNISEVKILKGESAIKQYKEKGNNGVMIITTK